MIEFFVFPKKLLIFNDKIFLWHFFFSDQLASKHVVVLADTRTTLSLFDSSGCVSRLSMIEFFVFPKKLLIFHDNNFLWPFCFRNNWLLNTSLA